MNIPERSPSAPTGSEFIANNYNNSIDERESNILDELLSGNVPDNWRSFKEISVSDGINTVTYFASPDYVCIGTDDDFIRIPLAAPTAQKICDAWGCSLPTKKMVDDIWKNAYFKLSPLPWGPPYDATMMSSYRYKIHNERIQSQLTQVCQNDPYAYPYSFHLVAGHKKDIVLTNKLSPSNPNNKVAIYGWHQSNGVPIQGLNPSTHELAYKDYSHGARLIDNIVKVTGLDGNAELNITQAFSSFKLAALLNDEASPVLTFTRY